MDNGFQRQQALTAFNTSNAKNPRRVAHGDFLFFNYERYESPLLNEELINVY